MKRITITIVNGEAVIETSGFTGGACLAETADVKAALGQTTRETVTAEFRQAATVKGSTIKAGGAR